MYHGSSKTPFSTSMESLFFLDWTVKMPTGHLLAQQRSNRFEFPLWRHLFGNILGKAKPVDLMMKFWVPFLCTSNLHFSSPDSMVQRLVCDLNKECGSVLLICDRNVTHFSKLCSCVTSPIPKMATGQERTCSFLRRLNRGCGETVKLF